MDTNASSLQLQKTATPSKLYKIVHRVIRKRLSQMIYSNSVDFKVLTM